MGFALEDWVCLLVYLSVYLSVCLRELSVRVQGKGLHFWIVLLQF
jgi:hypothetical protein